MNRVPSTHRNTKVQRDRDKRALSRLALLLFCGLILAGGFVYAAKQHFAAVHIGYQSESLRQERQKLLEEQQHLKLQRERAFAPATLQAQARKLGLQPIVAGQVGTLKTGKPGQMPMAPALLSPSASLQR